MGYSSTRVPLDWGEFVKGCAFGVVILTKRQTPPRKLQRGSSRGSKLCRGREGTLLSSREEPRRSGLGAYFEYLREVTLCYIIIIIIII